MFAANIVQVDIDKAKCRHCDKLFFEVETLKKHIKYVHNQSTEKGFMCKYCGMVSEKKNSIHAHELRAHGNLEYAHVSCELCGKAFFRTYHLKNHIQLRHEEVRCFSCDICTKSFKQKPHLLAHILIHSGKKNFLCKTEGCDKAFSKEWTLTQHERIHTGVKPYKCEPCDVAFAQKNSLNVHNNTYHKEQ